MRHAKVDDPLAYQLLQTIPGMGKILALVLLYEMHELAVSPATATSHRTAGWSVRHESAGKSA